MKWKFSRGLSREIRENKTTPTIVTMYSIQTYIVDLDSDYINCKTFVFLAVYWSSEVLNIIVQHRHYVKVQEFFKIRPPQTMSLGPFTLAKIKIQKTWVFCCTVYTARKPITFGVFGTKSACAKKPESHTCVLVSGAHARLLSTFDRTRVVRITSRATVGWFRWRSRTTWPKTWIILARLERAFTLAKNQWNFGGVSKNHAAEVSFFYSGFLECLGEVA